MPTVLTLCHCYKQVTVHIKRIMEMHQRSGNLLDWQREPAKALICCDRHNWPNAHKWWRFPHNSKGCLYSNIKQYSFWDANRFTAQSRFCYYLPILNTNYWWFLVIAQLDTQILFNVFIYLFIILYMFRACHAHHQEKQIVSIQLLVIVTPCWWQCRVLVGSKLVWWRCGNCPT